MRRSLFGADLGARTGFVYNTVLKGFSATLTDEAVRALRPGPTVSYVERSTSGRIHAQKTGGPRRMFADANPGLHVGDGKDERGDADVAILDTGVGSGETVSHSFAKSGYWSVSLTVTGNAGKTHKSRQQVKAGDGGSATTAKATHTYPAEDGTYTVRLTVNDNKNQAGTTQMVVQCRNSSTAPCVSAIDVPTADFDRRLAEPPHSLQEKVGQ